MKRWTEPPKWLEWRFVAWLRNPYVQMRLGVCLLGLSTVTWTISQLTNRTEPPMILALSWLAVWLTGLTLVLLTDVGETTKENE